MLDDRAFLLDPSQWPVQVPEAETAYCALKLHPNRIVGSRGLDGVATLMHTPKGYLFIHTPFPTFLSNPNAAPPPQPTTVDALLADGWIVD